MPYVDIVFPLSLGPLTYRCPDELYTRAEPGAVVSAPLRGRPVKGILWNRDATPPGGAIRDVTEISEGPPVLGKGLLGTLRWMSGHYLASEGIVLKQTVPAEIFRRTRPGARRKSKAAPSFPEVPNLVEEDVLPVLDSLRMKKGGTFLFHAPSSLYEHSLVSGLIERGGGNVLIVLPGIADADLLYGRLCGSFGDRVCVLHHEISRGRRSGCIEGIISGRHDIVVGTRSALFAPLRQVSLVVVLQEHSGLYKLEEGVRYNIRDAALMRGRLDETVVVLSSVCPTVDSYYRAISGDYALVTPAGRERPRIRVLNMRYEEKVRPGISRTVADLSRTAVKAGRKIMLVVHRRGYATLLHCRDCGHGELCARCRVPMVMHRRQGLLKCHYCGDVRTIPERCSRCGSYGLELLGAGTERMQEDMAGILKAEAVRIDSDRIKKGSDMSELVNRITLGPAKVVVGTKMMTHLPGLIGSFSLAAVMNFDASMNFPDFRAAEKAYMELCEIMQLIEPGGTLTIQTRHPGGSLLECFKRDDYRAFVDEELVLRKGLLYPPFSSLISMRLPGVSGVPEAVIDGCRRLHPDVELLGPTEARDRRGTAGLMILLKSPNGDSLRAAALFLAGRLDRPKESRVVIDVDPA